MLFVKTNHEKYKDNSKYEFTLDIVPWQILINEDKSSE